jgi:hypothetical protein
MLLATYHYQRTIFILANARCPPSHLLSSKRLMESSTSLSGQQAAHVLSRLRSRTYWHMLDRGMSVVQALAQPRLHDQLVPAIVSFEWTGLNIQGYDNRTVSYLKSLEQLSVGLRLDRVPLREARQAASGLSGRRLNHPMIG